jgi:hypothetical protein
MSKRRAEYTFDNPEKKARNDGIWKSFQKLKPKKKTIGGLPVNNYVSGTGVKNFLLRDPVLDWFDLYYFSHGVQNKIMTRNQRKLTESKIADEKSKLDVLFEGGNDFESKVLEKLSHTFEGGMVTINECGRNGVTRKNF